MMVGIGVAELLCLGVFFAMFLGVLGLLLLLQIKRQAAAPPAAATNAGPASKPMPAQPTPPRSSFAALSSEASVAAVARIAERFCPACRGPLDRDAPEGLCPACLLAGGIASEFAEAPGGGFAATTPPGQPSEPADHDIAGLQERFPQLEVLELLGRGGMGSVYKVRQRNLDRVVALKVIPPAAARDPEFAERFAREARALARLNHPNIVTVYDFGQTGDVYYLLMEYVDGVNLRHTLRAGNLQPEEALAVVPQICDALQYAHDQGVVHRDIKPENVLLDRSGRIKIADFGLAKLLGLGAEDFHLTRTQQVMGTPRYMAPEQIERPSQVDHRADIYSLGVVIYEMLTGELPVGRFALPSQKSSVDPRVDQVVLRSLEKEPELRYQRASQVKLELASASAAMHEHAEWSGPRFPTPAPVYRDPKPPYGASEMAGAWPPMLLLLAAGIVAGCLMITAGLAMLAVALFSLDPGSQEFGGWLGAAFGFICGGGGTLVGGYNSYRQLAGAEDLLRTPHTTWFDWVMRGFLLVGILLTAAAFIDFPDGNPSPITFPGLLIVGSVMVLQGALFALIRSLLPTRNQASQLGKPPRSQLRPTLWRAAGIPTLIFTAIWVAIILNVFYATPLIAADDRTARWMTYLFYTRWQAANWAIGVGLIPICFAVLASFRSLGARRTSGTATSVAYPFEHPGWLLAVAALALSTAILPWVRLEHFSDHTVTVNMMERRVERDVANVNMPAIAGFTGQYRYASREVVTMRIALCLIVGLILGVLPLLSMPSRVRFMVTLAAGVVLLACSVLTLHDMADQPSKFFLDARTIDGITDFYRSIDGGTPDLSEWARPLAEVIAVRPALGFFALLAATIGSLFLGLSGLSWEAEAPPSEPVKGARAEAAAQRPLLAEAPLTAAERLRQRALDQVRGPANGLCIAGILGLSLTAMVFLLGIVITPTRTVVTMSATPKQAATALNVAWRNPSSAAKVIDGLASQTGAPSQLAQEMAHRAAEFRTPAQSHASWMAVAMPTLLVALLNMPISFLLVVGSVRMKKLESYPFALGVSVLACIPCTPVWLVSLPIGLWSLSVLARPEVKAAFDQPTT